MKTLALSRTLTLCVTCLTMGCSNPQPIREIATTGADPSTGFEDHHKYHFAYVDVKDSAHHYQIGNEPGGDESYVRSVISRQLEKVGMDRRDYGNNARADIHVICRFRHKLMKPAVTPGFQIKVTDIGQCTLKIIDLRANQVLFDKSWMQGNQSGGWEAFIEQVFTEWKIQGAGSRHQ